MIGQTQDYPAMTLIDKDFNLVGINLDCSSGACNANMPVGSNIFSTENIHGYTSVYVHQE
jgi:hypothetical protein